MGPIRVQEVRDRRCHDGTQARLPDQVFPDNAAANVYIKACLADDAEPGYHFCASAGWMPAPYTPTPAEDTEEWTT